MDTRIYDTQLAVTVEPIGSLGPPHTQIVVADHVIWDAVLEEVRTFRHNMSSAPGSHSIQISLCNKQVLDPDQALKISMIELGGISDPQFVWKGVYRPCYPDLWAQQQLAQGQDLPVLLTNTDYLGWNGTWTLEFAVPIYSWIHKTKNLGWLYQ